MSSPTTHAGPPPLPFPHPWLVSHIVASPCLCTQFASLLRSHPAQKQPCKYAACSRSHPTICSPAQKRPPARLLHLFSPFPSRLPDRFPFPPLAGRGRILSGFVSSPQLARPPPILLRLQVARPPPILHNSPSGSASPRTSRLGLPLWFAQLPTGSASPYHNSQETLCTYNIMWYQARHTSSMSCVFLHNNLTRSALVSSMNSKDICANHVRPHASTGMRPRIPNLEFMRAPQFLKYCVLSLTKLP